MNVLLQPRTILPNNTFGGGQVVMRLLDRVIDQHPPIDPASSVYLGLDQSHRHVKGRPVGTDTFGADT